MRTTFSLASGSIGFISISAALAALSACSATNGPGGGTGNGGQSATGNGGQSTTNGGNSSSSNGGTSSSSNGGSTTTTGNGGTTSTTSGGSTSTTSGGSTSTAGAAGAAAVVCSNTDKSIIPIDKTGWVARECNNFGIQGAWYCYTDGMTQAGCTANMPPYVEASKGMCLKGNTLGMTTAWGAGIGLSLNDSGKTATMASVKSAYNASTNGVKGFQIGLTGTTGGLPLRINFPKLASPTGVSPFVEVPGAPATTPYNVLIADALVPKAWMVTNAGETADPTSLFDLQIQLPGDSKATAFDFCITSVTPITDGTTTPVGGTLMPYGSAQCDQYAKINVPNYMIQNNAYGGNTHCVQAKTDNSTKAGLVLTNLVANKPTGGAPGSYPSVVYGWHVDGKFYGAYTTAKQLSAITSAQTSMNVTVPSAGRYNTSYDVWINNSATASSSAGTLELMVWLNYRDTTPIGTKRESAVSLAGATWDIWWGEHDGFQTISYIRTNTNSMSFDLNVFFKDMLTRTSYVKNITASSYLLGVQAGFEIWEGSGAGFSVDSFDVAVK
ncbi:MAG: hypothetical protein QM756_14180 [Polyangiaceae bacterium]